MTIILIGHKQVKTLDYLKILNILKMVHHSIKIKPFILMNLMINIDQKQKDLEN